jgi:hypothetical protein
VPVPVSLPLTAAAKKEKQRKARDAYLRRNYGIGLERYEEMVLATGGRCPICLCRVRKWCVDHDHFSGKVRGVLCTTCNVGLGHFARDDIVILKRAIEYLRVHLEGNNATESSEPSSCASG